MGRRGKPVIIPPDWRHPRDYRETLEAVGYTVLGERVFYENYSSLEETIELHRIATVPVSGGLPYAGYDTPDGYFLANGAEILIDAYSDLYNLLTNFGTTFPYGANTNGSGGAGTTHFRLPNLPAYSGVKYIIKY